MSAERKPPAEKPSTPTLCGSICHSFACRRTRPTARCASSSAAGIFGVTWQSQLFSQCGPLSGTRYLSTTQVTPFDVSQSQTSVPSRSMARILYPPPGNTTTAAPVLLSFGAKIVMVGRDTLLTSVHGLPATGSATVSAVSSSGPAPAPGGVPGQGNNCLGPGCKTWPPAAAEN